MLVQVPHNTVMQGHVLDKLRELPNDCVDVVVTSTPYYGLRDYGPDCVSVWNNQVDCKHEWEPYNFSLHNGRGDAQKSAKFSEQKSIPDLKLTNHTCTKCGAWKGQLGLEPHPSLFVEHLAQVFLEIKRVLKPSGSLWLNLGDTYFGGQGQARRPENWGDLEVAKLGAHAPAEFILQRNKLRSNWLQPKQKMLIPARVAIALQDQGWILRNEVVWHKINHMPESCRDRLTRSWESVYFFVKDDKYYFDLTAIRKPNCRNWGTEAWTQKLKDPNVKSGIFNAQRAKNGAGSKLLGETYNPQGANPGDVWSLTNEGIKDEHFAAFPQKLVKRILEAAAPKEICNKCGRPKIRITAATQNTEPQERKITDAHHRVGPTSIFNTKALGVEHKTLGWKSCECNADFHPGLILDPFAGAGTALLVAHKMGYDWLGIELVAKYCKIIEKRIERHGRVRLDGFMLSNSSEKNGANII
jgi:DNA modification methylase